MSLRSEQYRALQRTRQFLFDLMRPSETKRIPSGIRHRAAACIRHYPHLDEHGKPRFNKDPFGPDYLWDDTRLQALRVCAEILATQDDLDMSALCESMDLNILELNELFDRIQAEWETAKKENCPPRAHHE